MRVVLFHEVWNNFSGGGAIYLLNLAKGLSEFKNVEVTVVLLLCEDKANENFINEELTSLKSSFKLLRVDISEYAIIRNPRKIIETIQREVAFANFDLAHHTDGGAWGILAGKEVNYKLSSLVTYHHLLPKAWTDYATQKNKCVARLVDRVLGVSKTVSNELLRNYDIAENKMVTVYNGLNDLDSYLSSIELRNEYHIPKDDNIIGYIGRLEPEKNLFILLKAFKQLQEVWLVLIGDGSLKESLYDYCDKNKIEKVLFLGFRKNARNYLKMLNVLCLPSFSEACPFVLVESMIAEVPVVGSNRSGIKELLHNGDYGLLFDPESVEDLATKLRTILKDSENSQKMLNLARSFSLREFSCKSMVNNTLKVYNDAILEKKNPKLSGKNIAECLRTEYQRFFSNIQGLPKYMIILLKLRYRIECLIWTGKLQFFGLRR